MAARSYFFGLGKRKTAIACVKVYNSGEGKITVNGIDAKKYFFSVLTENALSPLAQTELGKKVDIEVIIKGGGKSAQSDALRLGISRALILMDPSLRPALKQSGFIRRDSRIKERKKPGLKGARRAPQWQKR